MSTDSEIRPCITERAFKVTVIIRDDHEYDSLSVEDIIVYSSNIGASKLALNIGDKNLYRAIKEAGFVMPLGVDFPGEVGGYINPLGWREHYLATVSFGHGISATPLQMVSLYEALAGNGYLHRPFFAEYAITPEGRRQKLHHVQTIRKVFSPQITGAIRDFLNQVVIRGTARKADSPIVAIAGKTGTALKIRADKKGYDQRRSRASFVGYFPADNPMIVGIVLFDEPKTSRYGGETAAPVFRNIAERYYCLPQFMVQRISKMGESGGLFAQAGGNAKSEFAKLLQTSARYGGVDTDGLIPDFRGLTIKQALGLAAIKGMNCEFDGTGIVYAQYPPAGNKYDADAIVKLKCKSE